MATVARLDFGMVIVLVTPAVEVAAAADPGPEIEQRVVDLGLPLAPRPRGFSTHEDDLPLQRCFKKLPG